MEDLITTEAQPSAQDKHRDLVLAFHRVFKTPDGVTVLNELKRQFFFSRWEGDHAPSIESVALRQMAKGPIFVIEKFLAESGARKVQRKAKS